MRASRLWIGLVLLLGGAAGAATSGWWVSYLDCNDIRQIVATDEGIWCATTGGALFYDPRSGDFRTWNRSRDGLASDSLTSVAILPDGKVAFGTAATGISAYDPESGLWFHYTELVQELGSDVIRFIREAPPWRIIGSDGGFVALEDEVVATPCREGLDLCGLTGWDVRAGIQFDGALFLASQPDGAEVGGVARYRSEVGWDTVSTGLPSREVTDFAIWDGELYCGTVAGIAVWDGQAWQPRSDGIPDDARVMDLYAGADRLLAAATWEEGGVFAWQPDASRWARLGTQRLYARTVAEDGDGIVWVGTSVDRSGLAYLGSSQSGLWEFVGGQWLQHRRDAPHPVASYRALAVDPAGRVWAAAQGSGVSWRVVRFDENGWSVLGSGSSGLVNQWIFDIRPVGDQIWFGHCCCPTPAECPFDILELGPGEVRTVDGVLNIWDSASAADGDVWAASFYEQANEERAAGLFHWDRTSGIWTQYDTETTGGLLLSNRVPAVAYLEGELWIGSDGLGLTRVTLDGQGELPLSAEAWTYFSADSIDGLPSNSITVLAAGDGALWVGTDAGATRWSDGSWRSFLPSPYGLPGSDVKDICLTEDGAAWIGVFGHGVTRISQDAAGTFVFDRFGPPDLVNPDVWALATGIEGRDVWVATNRGLSHFIPGAAVAAPERDEILVFPNPYNPACGDPLRFAALPGQAHSGLVVDVSGRVLARFGEKWSGDAFWDGRDLGGERVAPGLYLVRAATPRGRLTGRIAVVDLPCEGW
ncbi:MAG: hypothetical protein GF330_11425 [Candidatus Eisenbacteria bacterium]|nr:hypothetical protein [Candidatus Eisenbacteria bacterium]